MAMEGLPWVDVVGYLGGAVTLWGMCRKTIIPLRLGAVAGNVGFVFFGLLVPSYPTLVLHALLLPLNLFRTWQMFRLIREIRESAEGVAWEAFYTTGEATYYGDDRFDAQSLPPRING